MTVREILSDAAALSGAVRIPQDPRSLGAIRRALYTVFRDTGARSCGKILAVGTRPISRTAELSHAAGEALNFTVTGGGYAFEVSGKGSFTVRDRRGERRFSFDTDRAFFKGLLTGGGAIEFYGEYPFTVFNLSDYPAASCEERLPDGSGEAHYDLSELVQDFLSLASAPTDRNGGMIKGLRAVGSVLHLPEEYTGEVRFEYYRRPTSPIVEPDETVDLPREHAILLSPLVAAYLTSRDDPETSAECLAFYRDMLASLPKPPSVAPPELYYCKSRWA